MSLTFLRELDRGVRTERFGPDGLPLYSLPCTHKLSGPIKKGDGDRLAYALNNLSLQVKLAREENYDFSGVILCLDSPGGSLVDGLKIAEIVIEQGIPVRVNSGATCLSACFWVFMAGNITSSSGREILWRVLEPGGTLGYHRPSLSVSENVASNDIVQDIFQLGVQAVLEVSHLFSQQGFLDDGVPYLKPSLLGEVLNSSESEMRYINTVGRAGRWDIWVDTSTPGPRDKESFEAACWAVLSWEKDKDSVVSAQPLLVARLDGGSVYVSDRLDDDALCFFFSFRCYCT